MFDEQLIVGFSLSITVTIKLQVAGLPAASVAAQLTGVVPFGKVEPDDGVQLTVAPGQLSVSVSDE